MRTVQTVEEMREIRKVLKIRRKALWDAQEDLEREILENPTEKLVRRNILYSQKFEDQLTAINRILQDLKFDIEDITGEVED